jgi:hypothetical protein
LKRFFPIIGTFAVAAQVAFAVTEFSAQYDHGGEYHYYVFNWGDGTETPSTVVEEGCVAFQEHSFPTVGTFPVSWRSVSLSGEVTGWHGAATHRQKTPDSAPARLIPSGSVAGNGGAADVSGNLSFESPEDYPMARAGLVFPKVGKIETVSLVPQNGAPFPEEFRLEYCMDDGKIWLPVPRYTLNNYPDPEGRTVQLPLHGLAARGIRLLCPRLPDGKAAVKMEVSGGGPLLFEADADEEFNAALNNMWLVYGTAENEVHLKGSSWWDSRRPDEGGVLAYPGAEWSEWAAMQVSWIGLQKERAALHGNLRDMKTGDDGFVWASTADPRHLYHSKHAVNNPTYILALHRYFSWNPDPAFWQEKDKKTGETVLAKARRAMKFCLDDMQGKDGLLIIPFSENDGTATGWASNYWDAWLFGYKSAYANILFYASLNAMADIETWNGSPDQAAEYTRLAEKVQKTAQELFWDKLKGRLIGCIDKNGKKHDYGFTFVNLPAVAYGLASEEQTDSIMKWIAGERIIRGENATGADIYRWKFAAVPNTVDAGVFEPHWWEDWNGALSVGPGGKVPYGGNCQNGGAIFYLSYYDLMARLDWRGPDFAMRFFNPIIGEFKKDELRRNPVDVRTGMAGVLGIIGPFPESGNVPLFYLYGLMGIEPVPEGFVITPRLPSDWKFAKATVYRSGKPVRITCSREAENSFVQPDGQGGFEVTVPAAGSHRIKL